MTVSLLLLRGVGMGASSLSLSGRKFDKGFGIRGMHRIPPNARGARNLSRLRRAGQTLHTAAVPEDKTTDYRDKQDSVGKDLGSAGSTVYVDWHDGALQSVTVDETLPLVKFVFIDPDATAAHLSLIITTTSNGGTDPISVAWLAPVEGPVSNIGSLVVNKTYMIRFQYINDTYYGTYEVDPP